MFANEIMRTIRNNYISRIIKKMWDLEFHDRYMYINYIYCACLYLFIIIILGENEAER